MLAKDLATVQGRRLQEGDLVVDLRNLRRGSVKRLILEEGKVQIQWGENGPTSTTVSTYLKAVDSENG